MRIKTEGYSQIKADARRDRKRQEAEQRQAAHDALTTEEKLAKCNARRGSSARETERLTGVPLKSSDLRIIFNLKPLGIPRSIKK